MYFEQNIPHRSGRDFTGHTRYTQAGMLLSLTAIAVLNLPNLRPVNTYFALALLRKKCASKV